MRSRPGIPALDRYDPLAGPLQNAGAAPAVGWTAALAAATIVSAHPAALAAILVAVLFVAARCGVARRVGRGLAFAAPLALSVVLINPLVSREGVTVLVEGYTVPVLGALDITLEAIVYGVIVGFKMLVLMACTFLYAAVVDPDALLRLLRRRSLRSAVTASLATRLVPVIARDARRLADARRCRPGRPPGRVAVVRAVFGNVVERSEAVAVALETRGFTAAPPAARVTRGSFSVARLREWSTQALIVWAGALAVLTAATTAWLGGASEIDVYPRIDLTLGPAQLIAASLILLLATAPFALPAMRIGGSARRAVTR